MWQTSPCLAETFSRPHQTPDTRHQTAHTQAPTLHPLFTRTLHSHSSLTLVREHGHRDAHEGVRRLHNADRCRPMPSPAHTRKRRPLVCHHASRGSLPAATHLGSADAEACADGVEQKRTEENVGRGRVRRLQLTDVPADAELPPAALHRGPRDGPLGRGAAREAAAVGTVAVVAFGAGRRSRVESERRRRLGVRKGGRQTANTGRVRDGRAWVWEGAVGYEVCVTAGGSR